MANSQFIFAPHIFVLTLVALSGLCSLASADPIAAAGASTIPTVTCDKSPGAGLCYALSDALVDYGYNKVTGNNAVDAMLNGEASSGSNVVVQFEMAVLPTDIVSEEIAKMANSLALFICGQKVSGPPATDTYGYQEDVSGNKLLPRLMALQKQGGIATPKTCKLSL